jgi:hypothetical protein
MNLPTYGCSPFFGDLRPLAGQQAAVNEQGQAWLTLERRATTLSNVTTISVPGDALVAVCRPVDQPAAVDAAAASASQQRQSESPVPDSWKVCGKPKFT